MLIIRIRRRKVKNRISKFIFDFVVINKEKALYSNAFICYLGTFNKKTNILLLNLDNFYF